MINQIKGSWTIGAKKVPRDLFKGSSETIDEDPRLREEAWFSQLHRHMGQKKLL